VSSRKQAILLVAVAAALLALSNVPLLYGWLHHVPGRRFMGIAAGVRDSNFYFMMMEQADDWKLLLQNKFAGGELDRIYHGFFWALLGRAAHVFGLSHVAAFHAARAAAIFLFVPVAWYFIGRFVESTRERIAGLLMICFGAGAGWIQMITYYRTGSMPFAPADIATPEATSFFTHMSFPHLALALILIAACFALIEKAVSGDKLAPAFGAGVCGLVLGFIHVVNLVVVMAALAVYAGISFVGGKHSRPLRVSIVFGAVAIWPVIYYLRLSLLYPALLPQVPVRSPGVATYLVGFAPLLILSLAYIIFLLKSRLLRSGDLMLICWTATNFVLLYSYPLLQQEARAVLGLQLPLAVLATRGIFQAVLPALGFEWTDSEKKRKAAAFLLAGLLVTFTFPSTFCNIIDRISRLKTHPEAFSLTEDEYEALRFLKGETGEGVVLSGDVVGNYIPGMTGKPAWLGQYDHPTHDARYRSAHRVFTGTTSDSDRENFLRAGGIGFIFYGREERAMGDFDPDQAPYLESIYKNDSVSIYRTRILDPIAPGELQKPL